MELLQHSFNIKKILVLCILGILELYFNHLSEGDAVTILAC